MNKPEIIRDFAKFAGYTQSDASTIFDDVVKYFIHAMKTGKKLHIQGVGDFYADERKAMKRYNISTGESYIASERYVPKFEPSKNFRIAVREDFVPPAEDVADVVTQIETEEE